MRGTVTFFWRLPASSNRTMVTSFDLGAGAAETSNSLDIFHCHKASPPMAAAALPRKARRRIFWPTSRSRSESNIELILQNEPVLTFFFLLLTFPYKSQETPGANARLSEHR